MDGKVLSVLVNFELPPRGKSVSEEVSLFRFLRLSVISVINNNCVIARVGAFS